jgi:hypothetical protein
VDRVERALRRRVRVLAVPELVRLGDWFLPTRLRRAESRPAFRADPMIRSS